MRHFLPHHQQNLFPHHLSAEESLWKIGNMILRKERRPFGQTRDNLFLEYIQAISLGCGNWNVGREIELILIYREPIDQKWLFLDLVDLI